MTDPMDLIYELLDAGEVAEARALAKDQAYMAPEVIEARYQQLRAARIPGMPRFWLVCCPSGPPPPRFKHGSETAAQGEAERMAETYPGQHFYVVEAKSRLLCKIRPVAITPCSGEPQGHDDIPF